MQTPVDKVFRIILLRIHSSFYPQKTGSIPDLQAFAMFANKDSGQIN